MVNLMNSFSAEESNEKHMELKREFCATESVDEIVFESCLSLIYVKVGAQKGSAHIAQ